MTNDSKKRTPKQGILAQVVFTGLAFGGAADVEVTSRFDLDQVIEAIEDDQLAALAPELRTRAFRVLAGDPRPTVRAAVAFRSGSGSLDDGGDTERLLAELAADPVPAVRRSLARGLAVALCELAPLERIERVCSWATSAEPGVRLAAALVLAEPIDALGATSCLEQLARDPSSEVRQAIAIAARNRRDSDPMRCRAVLAELSRDPDQSVAHTAWRGLST